MKRFTMIFALLALLLALTTATSASVPHCPDCEDFEFSLVEMTRDGNTSIWGYETYIHHDIDDLEFSYQVSVCYELVDCWPDDCELDESTNVITWNIESPGDYIQWGFITAPPSTNPGIVEVTMFNPECTFEVSGPACSPNGEPIGDVPPRGGFQPPIVIDDIIILDIGPPVR